MPDRKPPRMRAACGHCHAAKVKCSGDKAGCTRCLKLGLRCEYGVSMVGRASKKKGPATTNDKDTSMTDASSDLPLLDTNPADAFSLPLGEDFNFNFAPQDLMSIAGLNDFSFHAFPDNLGGADHDHRHEENGNGSVFAETSGKTPGASAVPELSMAESSINGDSPRSINQQSQSRVRKKQQQRQQQQQNQQKKYRAQHDAASFPAAFANHLTLDPSNAPLNGHGGTATTDASFTNFTSATNPYPPGLFPEIPLTLSPDDSERVSPTQSMEPIFCFARLSYYLERHLARTDDPLDRTLMVIRSGLRELMELVKWDGVMPSYGCRALIFACLTLIVKLYSKAYQRHRQGHASAAEAAVAAVAKSAQRRNGEDGRDSDGEEEGDGNDDYDDDDDEDGITGLSHDTTDSPPLPLPLHLQPYPHTQQNTSTSYSSSSTSAAVAAAPILHGPNLGPNVTLEPHLSTHTHAPASAPASNSAAAPAPPPMRFGEYEVDPADQLRLQNQVIAAELGRCVAAIKTLAREATAGCERGPDCRGRRNFEDLAQTATNIQTQLAREKERETEREREEAKEREQAREREKNSRFDRRMVHPLI